MNVKTTLVLLSVILASCGAENKDNRSQQDLKPIVGTWKLLTGTLIEKGDTTVTDYTKNQSFIKIINDSHFAFLLHDLSKGKEAKPVFSAGGGMYSLKDSLYTE